MSIQILADISAQEAAQKITDGAQDNGIDAIHYHASEKVLYIVQSKWKQDINGSLSRGDAQKFITGFRDILNARFDRFNEKVRNSKVDLQKALDDAKTRFVLVVAHSGKQDLANDVAQDFKDLLNELNDPIEVVTLRVLKQANLYS